MVASDEYVVSECSGKDKAEMHVCVCESVYLVWGEMIRSK